VFEKTTLPFLTIIFLTSRAGLIGRRGENVANAVGGLDTSIKERARHKIMYEK